MQTKRQAAELLHTQMSARDENASRESYSLNSELIQRNPVKDTPFEVVSINIGTDEEAHFGVLGKYRITENSPLREEILKVLQQFSWDIVLKLLGIIIPEEINRILEDISKRHKEHQQESANEADKS